MNNYYKLVIYNIALYTFISLNPYIRWLLPNELFYFFFIASTFFLAFFLEGRYYSQFDFSRKKQIIAIYAIIFIIHFTTPIIHDLRIGHLLWITPFLIIIFYKDKTIYDSYKILKKIMVWVAVASVVYWFLNLLSVPLPYLTFTPDHRQNPDDYYRIFGLVIGLYRGDVPVGQLIALERLTGVFAEPGHFGIYIGLLLAIEKFNVEKWDNKALLLAGLLTFSTAFYGILIMILIYRLIKDRRINKEIRHSIFAFLVFLLLGTVYKGSAFYELFLGDVFSDNDTFVLNPLELTDSRVSEDFITNFDSFSNTADFLFGYGYSDLDSSTIRTTNWRGLVFRFGVIGISIIISFFIAIIRRTDMVYGILLFSIALLVLLHRSYLLYTPWMYILLYMATAIDNYNKTRNLGINYNSKYPVKN